MKTKYGEGYTLNEVATLVEGNGFTLEEFWKEFGVNTVIILYGETIYFHRDVEGTLHRLKTGEKESSLTWD